VRAAPSAASSVAGEPVAGNCAGAAAGATAGTIDAGRTWGLAGSLGTGRIDARGMDDEVELAAVELDDGGTDDELGGTLDDELGGTDDDELGGTLDDELLVLTIDVLDISVVAPAGPLRTAMSPSTSPTPSTDHPALALPSMTSLPDCPAWASAERMPEMCQFGVDFHGA
jgi:hypothetical protein